MECLVADVATRSQLHLSMTLWYATVALQMLLNYSSQHLCQANQERCWEFNYMWKNIHVPNAVVDYDQTNTLYASVWFFLILATLNQLPEIPSQACRLRNIGIDNKFWLCCISGYAFPKTEISNINDSKWNSTLYW